MTRNITTYLIVVVLLACPYICLGEQISATAQCSGATCCCCRTPEDERSDAPLPVNHESGDHDCLCHGAIVRAGLRALDFDATPSHAFDLPAGIRSLASVDLLLKNESRDACHGFPPLSTGRDICALTGAFLL